MNLMRSRSIRIAAVVAAVPLFLVSLVVLGVLPVRAYATQRADLRASAARLDLVTKKNAELRERVRLLRTDAEIKRIAREQYAMVAPGEKLLVIPGLADGGRTVDQVSSASADRVPAPTVERTDSSIWRAVTDLLRVLRPA
jgi:cell division protein FtsB